MKNRALTLVFVCMLLSLAAQAQGFKIGYTNLDYILSFMPELKGVESEYKAFETQIANTIKAKQTELETKLQEYRQNEATMTDLTKADKQAEIRSLDERFQKYREEANQSIAKKQGELFAPLFEKIGKAIKEVQQENGYDMILSTGTQGLDIVLAADEKHDVNNLIFKKLGITPPAPK